MRALQSLVLSAVLLTGGVVTAGGAQADPYYHPVCRTTSPGIVLGAGPYGSEYTTDGVLIETIYGGNQAGGWGAVNCRYQGKRWRWTASSGAVYLGTTTWLEARIYNGA
jgi:hypothetical protein